jgi:2-keto-4-pentenoate hydratase
MMTHSSDIAQAMHAAFLAGTDWPLPSQTIESLDAATAYDIQREFVAQRLQSDPLVGFKAGATAVPAQQAFGLEAPFVGVLLASGRRAHGSTVAAGDFAQLLLETELCFRVGTSINSRIDDVEALRGHIDGCFPAIELADAGGFGRVKFTGPDLIAGNGASAAYMLGPQINWPCSELDSQAVSFSRDGQVLHEAGSGDLMGSQWQALLWLVNKVIDLGYQVQAGQLLLSGSLGSPHPGQPGHYVADFSGFGQIAFEVI